jgi:hypothetical protein
VKPEYLPWQELAVGAKPCPKCGKTDPHYRHCVFYKDTDAVCCGGEGCGFYQSATSREKALAKWNKATADTPCSKVVRKDAFPEKEIDHHLTMAHSYCANCKLRKELYKQIPQECLECGHLKWRDQPYSSEIPVYKE